MNGLKSLNLDSSYSVWSKRTFKGKVIISISFQIAIWKLAFLMKVVRESIKIEICMMIEKKSLIKSLFRNKYLSNKLSSSKNLKTKFSNYVKSV